MADEVVVLGMIDFELPFDIPRYSGDMRRDQLAELSKPAAGELYVAIMQIETLLEHRYGQTFRIADGVVSAGSIKFRDGQLIVTAPALAYILVGYSFVVGYPDLRSGVLAMLGDVNLAIETVAPMFTSVLFAPQSPEKVADEVILFLPPDVQRRLGREGDPPQLLTNQ
ncbi:MAG: hypothetical protein JNK01_06165 [Devosia sp.]|nr:hypothetical protein [Devosia sp.]